MGNFFKKYWWLLLIIIFLLILIIIWLLATNIGKKESVTTPSSATQSAEATKSATPSTQKSDETGSDDVLLKKAVSEKTGIAIDIIVVEISENTGKYAKGLVNAKGETVGGGYWLAVKTSGKWTIVYDGQATPECSQVDPPGFPASMVPECFDETGNIVTRK
ncbi:MAG: hypothetical protein Q8O75_00890 [bacterium]|nr:hypothetical protein [bacterium]